MRYTVKVQSKHVDLATDCKSEYDVIYRVQRGKQLKTKLKNYNQNTWTLPQTAKVNSM